MESQKVFYVEQWNKEYVIYMKDDKCTDRLTLHDNLRINLEEYTDKVESYGGYATQGVFKLTVFHDTVKAYNFIENYLEPQYIGQKLGGQI
jgi:hypothetical protein